ncbi:MAG: LapA family protein [Verrucomicrobiae bacterium]|nr:LapA family protein [Verrucomicrobiae bacterium]NNJ87640.1 LapA family protein [Akkermansiaceae bacterium]
MDAKKIKLIVVGIVIVLMGIIVFQNFEDQEVIILFAKIRMPLAFLLMITFATGMVVGWVLTLVTKKKAKSE